MAGPVVDSARPGRPVLAVVVRRAWCGHHAGEAQGGAPTDSSPVPHAQCAKLLEHHRRVAYPPGKATRRGALWGGGSIATARCCGGDERALGLGAHTREEEGG
jgi:hypothetical protein